jgi:hypothetical protein
MITLFLGFNAIALFLGSFVLLGGLIFGAIKIYHHLSKQEQNGSQAPIIVAIIVLIVLISAVLINDPNSSLMYFGIAAYFILYAVFWIGVIYGAMKLYYYFNPPNISTPTQAVARAEAQIEIAKKLMESGMAWTEITRMTGVREEEVR